MCPCFYTTGCMIWIFVHNLCKKVADDDGNANMKYFLFFVPSTVFVRLL